MAAFKNAAIFILHIVQFLQPVQLLPDDRQAADKDDEPGKQEEGEQCVFDDVHTDTLYQSITHLLLKKSSVWQK